MSTAPATALAMVWTAKFTTRVDRLATDRAAGLFSFDDVRLYTEDGIGVDVSLPPRARGQGAGQRHRHERRGPPTKSGRGLPDHELAPRRLNVIWVERAPPSPRDAGPPRAGPSRTRPAHPAGWRPRRFDPAGPPRIQPRPATWRPTPFGTFTPARTRRVWTSAPSASRSSSSRAPPRSADPPLRMSAIPLSTSGGRSIADGGATTATSAPRCRRCTTCAPRPAPPRASSRGATARRSINNTNTHCII